MLRGNPIPMSVDELMAKARGIVGVDIVDHEVIEPLTVLHRALCDEAVLHETGALMHQAKLLRQLCNRLRMQRDFARHPEIAEEQIEAPLFIVGMARSGTTKTQKVLSVSGDFNWLPFWQAYNPASFTGVPRESTQARIEEADAYCRFFAEASPESTLGHSFETFEPEEDTTLTENSFFAFSNVGYAEVPSYVEWLGRQNPARTFEFLRDTIKYLQWQGLGSASRRWMLKAPTYYGLEPVLLSVFPDARFVMTHRTPLQTVPSGCKLLKTFRLPFSDHPPNPQMLAAGFAAMMNLHLANRKTLDATRWLDVHFDEVNRSMPNVVERIYAHLGMTLTDAASRRMEAWERDHPMHKRGRFEYSIEEFGLTEEQVRGDMAGYLEFLRDRFNEPMEPGLQGVR